MSRRAEKRATIEIRRVHREDKLADKKMLQRQAADLTEKDAEIERLRALISEVCNFDHTGPDQFMLVPHWLSESGWWKRAKAALGDQQGRDGKQGE